MIVKNNKKKIFASILAGFMGLLCLIAPHVNIRSSHALAVSGANENYNESSSLEDRQDVELAATEDSGTAGTKVVYAGFSWLVPITFIRVSSYFGNRVHPITGVQSQHNGMDLIGSSPATDKPIIAARDGWAEVAVANNGHTGGHYVTIYHDDNGNCFCICYDFKEWSC